MSQQATLARPYARAAFEAAKNQQALDSWQRKLAVSSALVADARVKLLLANPMLSQQQAAELVLPADEAAESPYQRFVAELAKHQRLVLMPEIANLFATLKRQSENTIRAKVFAATKLDEKEQSQIRDALKKRFQKEVEMEAFVDESLIGGALIDMGEVVIDGSVRGKLARLAQELAN